VTRALAVINAGSATIKFAAYTIENAGSLGPPCYRGSVEMRGAGLHLRAREASGSVVRDEQVVCANANIPEPEQMVKAVIQALESLLRGLDISAFGHRVVHGGDTFLAPVVLDNESLLELERLCPLAPLHQPHNIAAVRAAQALKPQALQVACFDTMFHRTQPQVAQMFGLPRYLFESGIKRYGFHGLSYEYIAGVLPDELGVLAEGKIVVAHLGNGASMCALEHRRSVATTMGFTALDGLLMGTRCGSLDPGVVVYLIDEKRMDTRALTQMLYHESGLLGISGISGDVRELLANSTEYAAEALALFAYRAAREIGSLAAALSGLDALVFTGGIGEHAAPVREAICERLAWLGVVLDQAANRANRRKINATQSKVPVLVIATDEEQVIAQHTLRLLLSLMNA
jgi:acetate kinase